MEFRILGPLEVAGPDGAIGLGSRKQQVLLAVLLANRGVVVPADRLVDALWGEDLPKSAEHALHVHVAGLRQSLERGHRKGDRWELVVTDGDGYRIDMSGAWFDVSEFERLAAAGRMTEDPRAAARLLREAMTLWRGAAFGELADIDAVVAEASRLEQAKLVVREDLFDADLAAGRHAQLVPELEGALLEDRYSERLWGQLMLALYRSGRQAEALRAFGRVRSLLGEELGIEPGVELCNLEQRVLLQDPSLLLVERRPSGNLPTALSSFVGRSVETSEVAELLARARLVTLIGTPGIGKSRLALAVAGDLDLPGGTWFLDLSQVLDSGLLAAAVAHALGVDYRSADDPWAVIARLIGDRATLLLLDGCEHLVDAVADSAERLLGRCPHLRILATSRVTLGVDGEAVFAVPPMGPDGEGAALLIERGRAANPRLTIDEESARAISRELDGIPLSLEVAAVRLAVLTPQQLLAGLAARSSFALGRAGSPGRRPTLEDALDWSVDSLPRLQREAYARLGVFRGGFDLDGAAAVLGSALDDVVVQLAVLTGHSLLTTHPSGGVMRYRMLEPVRQHSQQRLVDLSAVDAVAQAHADHFSALAARAAPRLRGRDQLLWLSRLDDEHDNIREALDHLIDTGKTEPALNLVGNVSWYWFLRSRLGEGWYWLERVIAAAGDAEGVPLIRALIAAGQFAWEQAANDQARVWLERAGDMAARCASPGHVAWADAYLAQLDLMEGDHESARVRAEEAIDIFASRDNALGVGFGAWVAAMAAVSPGLRAGTLTPSEKVSAIETLTPLSRVAEDIGDLNLRGHLSWSLGMIESVGGDQDSAERHLLDGVRRFAELGNHSCLCHVLDAMAMVMADSGRLDESARLVGMVEGLRERIGNPGHLTERELRARCLRRLSEELDAESLARLTADGRTFASPEQAIAVVLDAAGRTVPETRIE